MGVTSWAIGSNPAIGAVTLTLDGGSGAEALTVVMSTSPFYLYDGGSGSFDAMLALQTAIRGASTDDLSGTDVFLTRDRKVRINFEDGAQAAVSVDLQSWSGAGSSDFQELLGFTGSELAGGGVTTFTSPETSPFLWSANKIESSTMARRGKIGAPYHDTAVGMSGTRQVVATTNNRGSENNFVWRNVINDRYWSADEDWGEYFVWWDRVQRRFRKFKIWRTNELDSSGDAATITDDLGPYVYRWDGAAPLDFPFDREIEFLEFLHTVEIPVVEVDEYT